MIDGLSQGYSEGQIRLADWRALFRLTRTAGFERLGCRSERPQSIQLLFTDVQMPPGSHNGFDLARQCAKSWPHIGILVSSGNLRPEPGDMPEGAIFVGKPFSHDVVRERLQELLPDGQQPDKLKKAARRN